MSTHPESVATAVCKALGIDMTITPVMRVTIDCPVGTWPTVTITTLARDNIETLLTEYQLIPKDVA